MEMESAYIPTNILYSEHFYCVDDLDEASIIFFSSPTQKEKSINRFQ